KSLSDPMENDIVLVYRVGSSGSPGTIKLNGTAQIAGSGGGSPLIDEKLELVSLPLQAANPFLAMAGQKRTLSGVVNGALVVKLAGGNQVTAKGQIVATDFAVGGELPFADKQVVFACDMATDAQ